MYMQRTHKCLLARGEVLFSFEAYCSRLILVNHLFSRSPTSSRMVPPTHMGEISRYQAMCAGTRRQKRPNRAAVQTTSPPCGLEEIWKTPLIIELGDQGPLFKSRTDERASSLAGTGTVEAPEKRRCRCHQTL